METVAIKLEEIFEHEVRLCDKSPSLKFRGRLVGVTKRGNLLASNECVYQLAIFASG